MPGTAQWHWQIRLGCLALTCLAGPASADPAPTCQESTNAQVQRAACDGRLPGAACSATVCQGQFRPLTGTCQPAPDTAAPGLVCVGLVGPAAEPGCTASRGRGVDGLGLLALGLLLVTSRRKDGRATN